MKEQILATKDEIIVRDLYPILVSNKRIYIVNGKKRNFKKVETKKIIQIDKISAVRYQFSKNKLLLTLSLIFLFFTLGVGGGIAYFFLYDKTMFDLIKPILIGCATAFLVLSFLFLILYLTIRKKVVWFEYPTNILKPTKVVFKNVKKRYFQDLVSAIFSACDKINEPLSSPFTSKTDLFI